MDFRAVGRSCQPGGMTENEEYTDGLAAIRARFAEGCWSAIDVMPDWHGLLIELDRALAAAAPDARYAQIREKFGGLRVYLESGWTDVAYQLIRDAEATALRTCEQRGAPGRMRVRMRWYRTLCDSCVAADAGTIAVSGRR